MSLTVLVPENDVVLPPTDEPRTPQWTPPLDAEGLWSVLERIKNWKPLDVEEVFDDLDTAIRSGSRGRSTGWRSTSPAPTCPCR